MRRRRACDPARRDLEDGADRAALIDRATAAAGRLDILVNDAGYADYARVDAIPNDVFRRLGESADIAAMVAMLLSRDGEWITGQVIAVDGGASIRP